MITTIKQQTIVSAVRIPWFRLILIAIEPPFLGLSHRHIVRPLKRNIHRCFAAARYFAPGDAVSVHIHFNGLSTGGRPPGRARNTRSSDRRSCRSSLWKSRRVRPLWNRPCALPNPHDHRQRSVRPPDRYKCPPPIRLSILPMFLSLLILQSLLTREHGHGLSVFIFSSDFSFYFSSFVPWKS